MSYLVNKVQSQPPNTTGEISVTVDQLNNFAGTPTANDFLVFGSGSDWTPDTLITEPLGDHGFSYHGVFTGGSTSIATNTRFDVGDRFIFRQSSGYDALESTISPNTTVASIAGVGGTTTSWYMSWDVDAGDWLFYTTTPIRPYSSSQMTLQWTDGTNYYGPKLELDQSIKCPDVHIAYISLSSTTEIWLEVMASNNSYLHSSNEHPAVAFNFIKIG